MLLGNGGRLCLKAASRPEYATPESDGVFDPAPGRYRQAG
jgi:hypothetical protein